MILLSYIIRGHPEWSKSTIRIFAAFPSDELRENVENLKPIVESGRLPISFNNVIPVAYDKDTQTIENVIKKYSALSDLVLIGFTPELLKNEGKELFLKYTELNDILFVSANQEILII